MSNLYAYAARMKELYSLLEDDLSRKVFWARLQTDCEHKLTLENEAYLFGLSGLAAEQELSLRSQFKTITSQLQAEGKKLFLYGASTSGEIIGNLFLQAGDFFAYCARNHEKYTGGVLGKPVYSPEYLFMHPEECYVVISAVDTGEEIYQNLIEHDFPENHIFWFISPATIRKIVDSQYFEFPELYPRGKAFVDAGCYDGSTSKRFAEWCHGNYSKIFAIEADPENCQKLRAIFDSSTLRVELIPFGLSGRAGELTFAVDGKAGSHVIFNNAAEQNTLNDLIHLETKRQASITTVALDDIVGETEVGFIKMDIEGEELNALHGAEKIILKDKPLLAICVYHRCGDVLAIMDYLQNLVPHYHFWLRHYGWCGYETVLYASVLKPNAADK